MGRSDPAILIRKGLPIQASVRAKVRVRLESGNLLLMLAPKADQLPQKSGVRRGDAQSRFAIARLQGHPRDDYTVRSVQGWTSRGVAAGASV
jgi:hypothetical protein